MLSYRMALAHARITHTPFRDGLAISKCKLSQTVDFIHAVLMLITRREYNARIRENAISEPNAAFIEQRVDFEIIFVRVATRLIPDNFISTVILSRFKDGFDKTERSIVKFCVSIGLSEFQVPLDEVLNERYILLRDIEHGCSSAATTPTARR